MISVEEALRALEAETGPLDVIELPLDRARGHVLAEPVAADRDFPPTDRSAMDGFAVRAADVTRSGQALDVVGEVRAGQPVGDIEVGPGQAVRIMTGSIVPPGADAVVMVERTAAADDERRVRIDDEPRPGQHIRRRGEDLERGRTALEPGTPIHAPEVAALASVGQVTVRVHRPPVVNVLSTGDEIIEADRTPADHQVRNSNAHGLLAQLAELGIEGRFLGIAGDTRGHLDRLLGQGLDADALLITGGVSVGKYDLVGEALEAAGMRLLFHKVAVKPGKPILTGRRDRCLVVGLPGNPVSTYTAFAVFVAPVLRRMLGYRRWENRSARATLTAPLNVRPGRATYLLARLEPGSEGLTARPVSYAGSGATLAMSRANGFIVCPVEGASHAAGTTVPVLAWQDFDFR
jgi:molybdopterin molybdotransferase